MTETLRALIIALGLVVSQLPIAGPVWAGHATNVLVDIKPGDGGPTPLNVRGTDLSTRDGAPVPVAILSTPQFDATTVDVGSVCFGDPNNATQRDCTESHGRGHLEDVDGDADTDVVLHYDINQMGFDEDDRKGCLEGRTQTGQAFFGCDGVSIRNGTAEGELPNLLVQLVPEPGAASARETVRWTATVRNDGAGAISFGQPDDVIRLDVPDALTDVVVNAPHGYACSGTAIRVCSATEPDTIAVGGSRTFTLDGVVPATPTTVVVKAVVDPSGIVRELTEADNAAEAAVVVQAANLVTTVTAEPGAVAPGDDVAWTATVRNDGPGAARFEAGSTAVRLTATPGLTNVAIDAPAGYACAPSATDIYDCTVPSVTTLAAGAEAVFRLSVLAPASPGSAQVTALADPDDVLTEGNEADNEQAATVFVENPNVIVALTSSPENLTAGDPVEWTATVTNLGPTRVRVPAGLALLELTYSPDLPGAAMTPPAGYDCQNVALHTFRCSALVADVLGVGAERTFRLNATAPAGGGTIDVTVNADPANGVGEADETDNSASRSTAVVVPPADLSITVTPAATEVDALGSTNWVARITNETAAVVTLPENMRVIRFDVPTNMVNLAVSTPSGYTCFLEAAGVIICATTAETTIPAHGSLDITLFGTVPRQPGPLSVTATADPLNVIPEANESNNAATSTITVRPPDFSITLTPAAPEIDALSSTNWVARITNDGPANARISTGMRVIRFDVPTNMVNLAVSTPSGYTCFLESAGVIFCQTTSTINLPAGDHVDITLFGTVPRQPGPLSVTATADPLNVIPEANESNNDATSTITVRPPDFSITLTPAAPEVDAAHSTNWVARITNDGPANARISTGMRVIRFDVPTNMVNLAVSTPSGYTCFLESAGVIFCQTTSTINLAAGSHVDITLFGTVPRQPGPLSVTATADPSDAIPEANETNNQATSTITVRPPDFVTALTAAPPSVSSGGTATWTATVTNQGPAVAKVSSTLNLLRFVIPADVTSTSVTAPAGYNCVINASTVDCNPTSTTNIPVGGAVEFSIDATVGGAPGSRSVRAIADPLGTIPEAEETNNEAVASVTVT